MTDIEAFRAGFLSRCVADGRDLPAALELAAATAKTANVLDAVGRFANLGVSKGYDFAKTLGTRALDWGLPVAAAGPWLAGGALGYGASQLEDLQPGDVDEVRDNELIDEYSRQTERLKKRLQARRFLELRPPKG